jgi:hypothetical protein
MFIYFQGRPGYPSRALHWAGRSPWLWPPVQGWFISNPERKMSQCKRHIFVILGLLLAAVMAAGCGRQSNPAGGTLDDPQGILSMPVPDGVEAALWAKLTSEFARVVAAQPRRNSAAAQGRGSQVQDFTLYPSVDEASATWTYRCQGDYDLNGVVSISDLTPIAVHFNKRTTDANWKVHQVADGDGNGIVNISDLTPLGQNLGARVAGYLVQKSAAADLPYEDMAFVPYVAGQPNLGEFPRMTFTVMPAQTGFFYRVVPAASKFDPYQPGVPSNAVEFTPTLAEQPWSQAGGNAQRTCLSQFNGPQSAGSPWVVDLQGSSLDTAAPVANREGVVFCTSSQIDLDTFPDLSGSKGSVWAIDRSGTVRWRFQTDAALYGHPILTVDGTVVVQTYLHELIGLYPDGKLRWRQQLTHQSGEYPRPLTYHGAYGIYAFDEGPNLRLINTGGSIVWTQPVSDIYDYFWPTVANVWLVYPNATNQKLNTFKLGDGTLNGTLTLGSSFDNGMFYKASTNRVWAGVNGAMDLQGLSLNGIDPVVNYDGPERMWTAPALNSVGQVVIVEIVPGQNAGDPPAGRMVGLSDNGSVAWDRPLAHAPYGHIACDAGGRVYMSGYNDVEGGSRIYCINAAHDVAFAHPVSGMPQGICIAGEGFLAAVHTASVDNVLSNAYLIGIDDK